jgi:3-oxoacyl-(acyl-carrier-protein) synthase
LILGGHCRAALAVGFEELPELVRRNLAARGLLVPGRPAIGEGVAAILIEDAAFAASRGRTARAELCAVATRCLAATDRVAQIEAAVERVLDELAPYSSAAADLILAGGAAACVERQAVVRLRARRALRSAQATPDWLGDQLGAAAAVRLAALLGRARDPAAAPAPIVLNTIDPRGNVVALGLLAATPGFAAGPNFAENAPCRA